jgi:hypothetical protein
MITSLEEDFEKGKAMDEKISSNPIAITGAAEDTVEAADQCTSNSLRNHCF